MATIKTKLTKEQVTQALKTLGEWFPGEAENFKKHHNDIVRHIIEGTEPKDGEPLLVQSHSKEVSATVTATALSFTPCVEAIAVFIVDVVFFALGLVGLHVSNQERMARALLRELGEDTLRGFLRAIHNFNAADGALAKAKALFAILGQIYNAGGFRAVFKVIKDEMSWWEWIKTGVIAVAQITAWFATDGAAFIAEAALSIMSAESLIEAGIKAAQVCK
ncbi:hypothetical protein PACLA_8A071883 [Paramuricea clavata]|uniref:Uncharacterized protein n=1 Tax=Paramuricea clavata TaxID=317549 RepID=A0A7D9DYC1_PARCT|nr:hypothetical protein PACLA_8A071883 [Paramuricea clavata]